MSIRFDRTMTPAYTTNAPNRDKPPDGEIIKTEVQESNAGGMLIQSGEEQISGRTSTSLSGELLTLQVMEGQEGRLVGRLDDAAVIDELAMTIIARSGLVPTVKRTELVRHAVCERMPLTRDLLLELDALWRQLDYRPAWLPILMRMVRNKLPLNKSSAEVLRRCEEDDTTEGQTVIYLGVDLTATPPRLSIHDMSQEQEMLGKDRDQAKEQRIVIGCETPHLGPVLVVADTNFAHTRVELLVGDEARRELVVQELQELGERLVPLLQSFNLVVNILPTSPTDKPKVTPSTTRLDIRV